MPTTEDDLALAHQLADLASEVALEFFHNGVETIIKEDNTPVSEADLEVDRQLVDALAQQRPDDAVLSEESGARGRSNRRWILDPIDGTFNFVEGRPAWGNHIALEVDGELVLGLITRPAYGLRWWATRGNGAYRADGSNVRAGERLHVSTVTELATSRVTIWSQVPEALRARVIANTSFVDGTLDRVLEVVQGDLDAVVAAGGKIWDHAPAVVLITEAGGTCRDVQGGRNPGLGPMHYTNGLIDAPLDRLLGD